MDESGKRSTGMKTKNSCRKIAVFVAILLVVSCLLPDCLMTSAQAAQPALNRTKKTMVIGSTCQLRLNGTTKKVTWSSGNRKIATVSSGGKVTAKRKGTTTITAKVGSKKYKCKITVVTMQTGYVNQTVHLINKERRKYGYASFDTDPLLQQAAQKRAKELYRKFSHTRPNGNSWASAISMKYNFKYAAENIACDFATPADVVEAWMSQADSKAKIISKKYSQIGVGVYLGTDGYLYWTAIFAKPK